MAPRASLPETSVVLAGANPGDFTLTNGCVAALAPGATCTINVAFRPVSAGTKAAQVVITHNAGAPSAVTVGGTATAAVVPTATMPNTVAFGARRVGQTRTQTVRITNQGPGALVIGTPTATGPFTVTRGNCPASLAAGRNCSLNVSFLPTVRGAATGTLTVPGALPHVMKNVRVQSTLQALIAANRIPQPNANTLYFVFLPPGIVSELQGELSCQTFCGFHDSFPRGGAAVNPPCRALATISMARTRTWPAPDEALLLMHCPISGLRPHRGAVERPARDARYEARMPSRVLNALIN